MKPRNQRARRRRFKVGVRKEYFPRDRWPREFGMSYVEIGEVLAHNRQEAAELFWAAHAPRLLAEMLPNHRKVSLDVNDPALGVTANLGRLIPITVWASNPQQR